MDFSVILNLEETKFEKAKFYLQNARNGSNKQSTLMSLKKLSNIYDSMDTRNEVVNSSIKEIIRLAQAHKGRITNELKRRINELSL